MTLEEAQKLEREWKEGKKEPASSAEVEGAVAGQDVKPAPSVAKPSEPQPAQKSVKPAEKPTIGQGEIADTPAPATGRMRPPGEIGGHTVQPWEQPKPGAVEQVTAAAPLSKESIPTKAAVEGKETASVEGKQTAAPAEKESAPPAEQVNRSSESPDKDPSVVPDIMPPAKAKSGPGSTRPPRPGRSDVASRGPASGPSLGTAGDALVEAIVKALSENLARAMRQSVVEAVKASMQPSGASMQPNSKELNEPLSTQEAARKT